MTGVENKNVVIVTAINFTGNGTPALVKTEEGWQKTSPAIRCMDYEGLMQLETTDTVYMTEAPDEKILRRFRARISDYDPRKAAVIQGIKRPVNTVDAMSCVRVGYPALIKRAGVWEMTSPVQHTSRTNCALVIQTQNSEYRYDTPPVRRQSASF